MANAYDIGDLVRVSVTFKDSSGVDADPTAVTLTIRKPDLTTSTPATTKDSVGHYHADIAVDASGDWFYKWAGTGAVETAEEGTFFVRVSHFQP